MLTLSLPPSLVPTLPLSLPLPPNQLTLRKRGLTPFRNWIRVEGRGGTRWGVESACE